MRLFVALNFLDDVRRPLWEALGPLRDRELPVAWVRAENLHLNLKFLGDVDDAREPELREALRRAAGNGGDARPITVQLAGFGAFPDLDRPRVLWAGIAPEPALELLHHAVEREFAPLGFATEARPFRPHVTVGRARERRRPREFAGLEEALRTLEFSATTAVAGVDLMHSTLQPGGPVYQLRQRERLS